MEVAPFKPFCSNIRVTLDIGICNLCPDALGCSLQTLGRVGQEPLYSFGANVVACPRVVWSGIPEANDEAAV